MPINRILRVTIANDAIRLSRRCVRLSLGKVRLYGRVVRELTAGGQLERCILAIRSLLPCKLRCTDGRTHVDHA